MIITNNNKDVFESIARNYIREDSHWGADLDLIKVSLNELLKRKSNPKWLDVGCGPAFHLVSIVQLYPKIEAVGVDYSHYMLELARKNTQKFDGVTIEEKDVTGDSGDSIDEKYDLITFLNNGFGNLYRNGTNPEEVRDKVIQKIINSLEIEGYFVLSVYNKEKLSYEYGNNLTLLNKSNSDKGNLFIEYSAYDNKKIPYYSHWFCEKELHKIAKESRMKLDFLERRMYRFLVRYQK